MSIMSNIELIGVQFCERLEHIPAMLQFKFKQGPVCSAEQMYCDKETAVAIAEKMIIDVEGLE